MDSHHFVIVVWLRLVIWVVDYGMLSDALLVNIRRLDRPCQCSTLQNAECNKFRTADGFGLLAENKHLHYRQTYSTRLKIFAQT